MPGQFTFTLSLLSLLVWIILPCASIPAADAPLRDLFDTDVAPIFESRCLECHSGSDPEGQLNLTTHLSTLRGGESGAAIVAGSARRSLIWKRIDAGEMPPKEPLSDRERRLIRDWIDKGAVWGERQLGTFPETTDRRAGYDWWALQPLLRPPIPRDAAAANPIDAFVRGRLVRAGLELSPPAPLARLARRLTFDLIGLPPSHADVHRFLAASRVDPDLALLALVDRLLASQHFGERWGRHWLDVARFGESQGFERDKLREDSWYYRDWVIRMLNADMPYDQFVSWQIAGDVLAPNQPDAVTATGFLVAGAYDEVGQSQQSAAMRAVVRQDELEDYVGTVAQTFLGLTVNCARCHDHKFDPILQREYYRLASALGGVRHGHREFTGEGDEKWTVYAVTPTAAEETRLLLRGKPLTPGPVVTPGGVAAVRGLSADFELAANAPDADRRRQLAAWITSERNPLFARVIVNRLWHHHFGVGLVETPNDFGFSGGEPSHPALLDWLACELIESDWSLKRIHRLIVLSQTYRQASRHREEAAAIDAGNRLLWRKTPRRLEAEVLRDAILSVSGELNRQYGGPPYRDFETFTFNSQFYNMVDPDGPAFYRRTIYRTWIRSGRNHLLDAFDCPDPSATAPSRAITTTPIQSLALMNNSFVMRMAERFAEQVSAATRTSARMPVTAAFERAYSRSPSEEETVAVGKFVDQYGLPALCRIIFNSNEFVYVD